VVLKQQTCIFYIKEDKSNSHLGRRCFVAAPDNSSLFISGTAHDCEVAVMTVLLRVYLPHMKIKGVKQRGGLF
jgi:hypothetical protein